MYKFIAHSYVHFYAITVKLNFFLNKFLLKNHILSWRYNDFKTYVTTIYDNTGSVTLQTIFFVVLYIIYFKSLTGYGHL